MMHKQKLDGIVVKSLAEIQIHKFGVIVHII